MVQTVRTRKEVEHILKGFILNYMPVEFKHNMQYFKVSVNKERQQFEVDTVHDKKYYDSSWKLVDYVLEKCGY